VRLPALQLLTFDCYGTLVDWESGICSALRPVLAGHGIEPSDEEVLELYARLESPLQQGAWRPYREVLGDVVDGFGTELGFVPSAAERAALAASLGEWPLFPDTVAALRRLARRYRLGILSNIDDDLFAATAPGLGVRLDLLVTAEQVGAYKPAPAHFEEGLRRSGLAADEVLHVAQSLFHDIVPARALGWRTAWVNRRAGRPGSGATPAADGLPDIEVPDLAAFAALLEEG
jgi:2-haloacid dehalogenase